QRASRMCVSSCHRPLIRRVQAHLSPFIIFFFFNDPATTDIYTLSLHDALPIFTIGLGAGGVSGGRRGGVGVGGDVGFGIGGKTRSEEHTSELQSRRDLVCRLLLEKKKKKYGDQVCVWCTTDRQQTPTTASPGTM